MRQTLKISDMSCHHCEMTIENAVRKTGMIKSIKFNLDTKIVDIEGAIDPDEVVAAIEAVGYQVESIL